MYTILRWLKLCTIMQYGPTLSREKCGRGKKITVEWCGVLTDHQLFFPYPHTKKNWKKHHLLQKKTLCHYLCSSAELKTTLSLFYNVISLLHRDIGIEAIRRAGFAKFVDVRHLEGYPDGGRLECKGWAESLLYTAKRWRVHTVWHKTNFFAERLIWQGAHRLLGSYKGTKGSCEVLQKVKQQHLASYIFTTIQDGTHICKHSFCKNTQAYCLTHENSNNST